jgi:D-xylose transport system permease protein
MAQSQIEWLPLVFGLGNPINLFATIAFGLLVGSLIGAASGWLVGYQSIPSFIVTLGGLLICRIWLGTPPTANRWR